MDEYIRNSIATRKKTVDDYYKVPANMQETYDALFRDMEELGESCADVAEFETKFAAGPLNQRYMDLFTKLKPNMGKVKDSYKEYLASDEGKEALADSLRDTAETEMRIMADDLTKDILDEIAPDRHTIWRNSVFGHIEDAVEGVNAAKRIGGFLKNRKK